MRPLLLAWLVLTSSSALADEVIEVHGSLPRPIAFAKPVEDPRKLPPYTTEAILTDRWSKAWLFLDVSTTGDVTRVKFLKHAGLDLDPIAVKHAFGLHFTPARDSANRPARSLVVWPVEWPSYWWMQARLGVMTRMPDFSAYNIDHLRPPPCAGSGPLQLGSVHPVYRDCSVPNLSHADASEPWYTKP